MTYEEKNTLIESWRNQPYPTDEYYFNEMTYQWNPVNIAPGDTTLPGGAPNVIG
jgi:hypothetical protein